METFDVMVTSLGGLVLILAIVSKTLERSVLPPTLAALVVGVLLGPAVSGLVDLSAIGDRVNILEKAARLTLGIGLVSAALRIPKCYAKSQWRDMLLLVGAGMLLMWCVSAALVWLVLGVPFWLALLIGAILAPTDPIAASPIVTGPTAEKNIPARLRNAISFESGANDGLAYLIIFLPFLFLTRSPTEALHHWVLHTLLWEVLGAVAFGLMTGYAAARLLQRAEDQDRILEEWRLIYTVALALMVVGVAHMMHLNEILAVFAAGMTFTEIASSEDDAEEEHGQEAVNQFFSVPIFALFGTALPWQGWFDLGWSGIVLGLGVLLLRRLPVLLLLLPFMSSLRSRTDAVYVGWFGPIAVSAIYYSSLMEHRLSNPFIWDVVSLVIFASTIAHGVTAAPITNWYGRRSGGQASDNAIEKVGRQ